MHFGFGYCVGDHMSYSLRCQQQIIPPSLHACLLNVPQSRTVEWTTVVIGSAADKTSKHKTLSYYRFTVSNRNIIFSDRVDFDLDSNFNIIVKNNSSGFA